MPDPNTDMRDGMRDMFALIFTELANDLSEGKMTLGEWQTEMREELRSLHALELIAAAGGDKANVDPNDWLSLGNTLKSQYEFLAQFARDIADGKLSAAQIADRASKYAGIGVGTFWKQVYRDVDLPAQPCDGSTPCGGRCGCEWVPNSDGSYTWVRGKDDSCDDCIWREENWNPWLPEES